MYFSPLLSTSLQDKGRTALMAASSNGHSEAIKLLRTAPGIDVNQADKVSLYLLIPPYLAVRGYLMIAYLHPTRIG